MPCSCVQFVLLEVVGGLQTRQEYVSVNAAPAGTFEWSELVFIVLQAPESWKQRRGIDNMLDGYEE